MPFISILHAPTDRHFAGRIRDAFQSADIETDLVMVGPLAEPTARAELAGDVAMVVWSPTSENDDQLANVALAAKESGALVPVAIAGAHGPDALASLPAVDLSGWSGDQSDPRWRFVLEELELATRQSKISNGTVWHGSQSDDAERHPQALVDSFYQEKSASGIVTDAPVGSDPQPDLAAGYTAEPISAPGQMRGADVAAMPAQGPIPAAAPVAVRSSANGDLFDDVRDEGFDLYRELYRPAAPSKSVIERLQSFRLKPSSLPFAVAGFTGFAVLLGIAIINFAPGPVPEQRIAHADIPAADAPRAAKAPVTRSLRDDPVSPSQLAIVKPVVPPTEEDFRSRKDESQSPDGPAAEMLAEMVTETVVPGPRQSAPAQKSERNNNPAEIGASGSVPAREALADINEPALSDDIDPLAAVIAAAEQSLPETAADDALAGLIEATVEEPAIQNVPSAATDGADVINENEARTEDGELAEGDIDALDVTDYFAKIDDLVGREFSNAFEAAPYGIYFRDCLDCPDMAELGDTPIAMAIRETTFKQWNACVADGACNRYRPSDEGWGRASRPVVNVSYRDAQNYVAWLSKKTGHTYRLPSAYEWRDVAESGVMSERADKIVPAVDGYIKSENLDLSASALDRTLPAGAYTPNANGLFDMNGNVAEWTAACASQADQAVSCESAVILGGSWRVPAAQADPVIVATDRRRPDTGFRVVREIATAQ